MEKRISRGLVALMVVYAASQVDAQPPAPRPELGTSIVTPTAAARYLALSEDDISLEKEALLIAKGLYPDLHEEKYTRTLDLMSAELTRRLRGVTDPYDVIGTLNDYLFRERAYRPSFGGDQLNEVIDNREGNCNGLSCLYLVLAERLGLPLAGVIAPSHVFVQYQHAGITINIETTLDGKVFTIDDFLKTHRNISQTAIHKHAYLTPLTKRQFLAVLLMNRGDTRRIKGDADGAFGDFTMAVLLHPTFPDAYNNRAAAHCARKSYKKAIEDATSAIGLNPQAPDLYVARSYFYHLQGDNDRAIFDCGQALSLNPDDARTYYIRGLAHFHKSDDDKAIKDLSAAIGLAPNDATSYYLRACSYSFTGDRAAMLADLRTAFRIAPSFKASARKNDDFAKWRSDRDFTALLESSH